MIPFIVILLMVIMIGMLIMGLLRPPLTVILPLLAIYVIIMSLPYILPTIAINIKGILPYNPIYIAVPLIGFALGFGISIIAEKFLNINIKALLVKSTRNKGVQSNKGIQNKVNKSQAFLGKNKELNLEEIINEAMTTLRYGGIGALGLSAAYYEDWHDAILGMARGFSMFRGMAQLINLDSEVVARIANYERAAAMMGYVIKEMELKDKGSKNKKKGKKPQIQLITYELLENLSNEVRESSQFINNNIIINYDKLMDKLLHAAHIILQGVPVVVIYVDGVPRRILVLPNAA